MDRPDSPLPHESFGPAPVRRRRTWPKALLQLLRRGHLYAGLLMLPWVLLYGVTAFLFNHPTAFSDQPTTSFDKDAVAGTSLESTPAPADLAARVVEELNARQKPVTPYKLVEPEKARYTREFAFATVKSEGQQISVLVDVVNGGGTIRSTPEPDKTATEKAPFAVGGGSGGPGPRRPGGTSRPGGSERGTPADTLKLEDPLHERVKSAVPVILERSGYPTGEVTVTSVPDLTFHLEAEGKVWTATYNAQSGSVSGQPGDAPTQSPSARRFLTRLHLAHGYPGSVGAKWFWAVIVDSMAFVMLFWGISGLLMWWQIKATRRIGFVLLLLSGALATALGFGMYAMMTQ
jgi:hypothetical protein